MGQGRLKPDKLTEILNILSDEQKLDNMVVEWYGGEVSILDVNYFLQLIGSVRSIYPKSNHSVVTNMVFLSPEFLSLIYNNYFTHICTSYENLRFSINSSIFQQWKKNVERISKFMPIDIIITVNKFLTYETIKILSDMPFRYVTILPIKIPDQAEVKERKRISKHIVSIEKIKEFIRQASDSFGEHRLTYNLQTDIKIWNALHIFPDGSYGLPAPSDKGFPYEKNVIFTGDSIIYAPERIKYITQQKTLCAFCSKSKCNAEFKYKGFCLTLS
jgi:hypothetical protein